jgi:hypothetical protein
MSFRFPLHTFQQDRWCNPMLLLQASTCLRNTDTDQYKDTRFFV